MNLQKPTPDDDQMRSSLLTARPTGQELFDSLSQAEQDALIGPDKAQLIREGEATLADFVQHDGNFITRKPIEAVKAWNESDHPRGGDPKNPGRFSVGGGGKVPKWERQRRYNGWVRKLGPAEQEVLARQFYEKLWTQMQAYFGDIGQPPPELIFTDNIVPGMAAQVFSDENGIRQLQVSSASRLLLALRGPKTRPEAIRQIVHEWRHVFQNAELFWIARDQPHDDQPVEQDANAFAAQVLRTMNKNRQRKRKGLPLIQPVPYNPQNIAENIGKDPTTIPFP